MVEGVLASAQSLAAHARLLLTSSCVPSLEPRPSSVPDLRPSIGNPGECVKVADDVDSPVPQVSPLSPSRVTDVNGSGDGAATPLMDIMDTSCPGYFVAGECAPCPAATPFMDIVDTPCPGYFVVAGECAPCPAATPSIDIVDTSRSCPDSDVAGNCTCSTLPPRNPEDRGTTTWISVAAPTSRIWRNHTVCRDMRLESAAAAALKKMATEPDETIKLLMWSKEKLFLSFP